jgi:hypothetical protein
MTPYRIKFLNEKTKSEINFESNEKPVKGEVYSIQDISGKLWDAKVTEVTKYVIQGNGSQASLEYRCKIEEHEASGAVIGFGKRG